MPQSQCSAVPVFVMCLALSALTSGCSNSISKQLLNDGYGPQSVAPVNNLVLPPPDTMQTAVADQTPGFVEETALPADVPTLSDLSSRPVEGIDAPKVALSIDEDIAAKKINETIRWRGKRNADGIDLANSNGALCSGTERSIAAKSKIRVACSDGRIAIVQMMGGNEARLQFRDGPGEVVLLDE